MYSFSTKLIVSCWSLFCVPSSTHGGHRRRNFCTSHLLLPQDNNLPLTIKSATSLALSATLKHVQLLNQVDCQLLESFLCPFKYPWRPQKKELLYKSSLIATRQQSSTYY